MKNTLKIFVVLFLLVFASSAGPARAAYFVDTGTPDGTGTNWELSESKSIIAAQFIAPFTGPVTGIAGFLYYDPENGTKDYVWSGIHNNSNGDAYPGDQLGEGLIREVGTTPGWYGTTTVDPINLTAGEKYWVSMEALIYEPEGFKFFGYMPEAAPSFLANGAIYANGVWVDLDPKVGFRVEGSPVPLPGAVWLLGSGLLGLGAVGWRRRAGNPPRSEQP